jgi:hypothetical protein
MNVEAFRDFSGGIATGVEADLDAMLAWVDEALAARCEDVA